MTTVSSDADNAAHGEGHQPPRSLAALVLGSVGIVYGDIGASPLYAMKESLLHAGAARVNL